MTARSPSAPPIFGFVPAPLDARTVAERVLAGPSDTNGVAVIVTPNIQHVSLMRQDVETAAAVREADLIVCDGFPVLAYARMRGHALPSRTTGREIVALLMAVPAALAAQRMLAVVDNQASGDALAAWATRHGIAFHIRAIVAPPGLRGDAVAQADLVDAIAAFAPGVLLMCLGAPTSELFLHRHRAVLPRCWALCVGQSVKIALGLVPTPPPLVVALHLEWAWRIALEPRRLLARYATAAWGFAAAIPSDMLNR